MNTAPLVPEIGLGYLDLSMHNPRVLCVPAECRILLQILLDILPVNVISRSYLHVF